MLTPAEAAKTITSGLRPKPQEVLAIEEALGRVLAVDITSPIDLPNRDNSSMDGYAARSEDVRGKCPVVLQIIEHIPAGTLPTQEVTAGNCARIFTGAPIPEGADCVIRQEDTSDQTTDSVRIDGDRDAGKNIRRRGEDLRKGAVVLETRTPLSPAHIGVLASTAHSDVPVFGAPRIAVMPTGDEVVDLEEKEKILAGTKIGSSNTYTMLSMVREAGGVPIRMGIAKDDPEDVRRRFQSAAESSDLIVTSGGVSVGDHDHLRTVFEELGGEIKFWRIRMKPGKPVAFGVLNDTPWIGLPGNPVSTMVTFELFVRPAIRVMLGYEKPFRATSQFRVGEKISLPSERTQFLRAYVGQTESGPVATTTGPQGSGILNSMSKADALIIVPQGKKEVAAGEMVRGIFLNQPLHIENCPY
ncbi:MAG: molybdopterin molybdotransferase MoeA [Myxococcota bacterium]|nr:molybdopterin molybdotransferase MoeA [Myxococcota bacterium]